MKYFIPINQKVWLEKYPDSDALTVAIFEVLQRMAANIAELDKITVGADEYFRIHYPSIIAELPIFRIKSKHVIGDRVAWLKKNNLLSVKKMPENTLYIRFTKEALLLSFSDNSLINGVNGLFPQTHRAVPPDAQHNQDTIQPNTHTSYDASPPPVSASARVLPYKQESVSETPDMVYEPDEDITPYKPTRKKRIKTTANLTHPSMTRRPLLSPKPWVFEDWLAALKASSRRELRLIAKFVEMRGLEVESREQARVVIKRHIRAAKQVSAYSPAKVEWAVEKAEAIIPGQWAFETLIKILTR